MNTETGRILTAKEMEQIINKDMTEAAKCVPIEEAMMTLKQKETMQVSKNDGRSVLGKIRIKHRNSLRNKPCPCGSGIKFKKCCWDKTC